MCIRDRWESPRTRLFGARRQHIGGSRVFRQFNGKGLQADLLERRFENVDFYETEAKLNLQEEEFSVALFVAPALLSKSALSQTLIPA